MDVILFPRLWVRQDRVIAVRAVPLGEERKHHALSLRRPLLSLAQDPACIASARGRTRLVFHVATLPGRITQAESKNYARCPIDAGVREDSGALRVAHEPALASGFIPDK
jgi:hypothetical protein